jgi:membrane associated rhomboid family serine protease
MFLPLHDGVPLKNMKTPLATRFLIGVCVIAYLFTFYGPLGEDAVVGGLGFIPSILFGTEVLPEGYPFVPVELTLATNIFLHGSLFHLIGNMLFLWFSGCSATMWRMPWGISVSSCSSCSAGRPRAWPMPSSPRSRTAR